MSLSNAEDMAGGYTEPPWPLYNYCIPVLIAGMIHRIDLVSMQFCTPFSQYLFFKVTFIQLILLVRWTSNDRYCQALCIFSFHSPGAKIGSERVIKSFHHDSSSHISSCSSASACSQANDTKAQIFDCILTSFVRS